ncbi:MAG: hypothetical protein JWQ08_1892 [Deinococcus sp.]|nr:hypothetical protein [Deinococcus sp.]
MTLAPTETQAALVRAPLVRLFALDLDAQALFHNDLHVPGQKVATTFDVFLGEALLASLEAQLRDAFTPETR